MAEGKGSHAVMSKSLAKALIESGVQHYDLGGIVAGPMGLVGGGLGSSVGSLVGGFSDAAGLNNTFQARNLPTQDLMPKINQAQNQQQDIYAQQQNLAQTLLNQSQGVGPNPAQAMLAQGTGQNMQQQAALMASQRGASVNPALVARQAAQQGVNAQQGMLGQAAVLQAQQQLQAQQALQQQQNMMGGQNLQQQGIYQGALADQNRAQLGIDTINSGVAANNMTTRGGLIGGLLQAGGGMAAKGMSGGAAGMAEGGVVPGTPEVNKDSPQNDRVPALLSPEEIVLPLSVTKSKDPAKAASAFVKKLLAEKEEKGYEGVISAKKSLKDRVDHLEKLYCGGSVKGYGTAKKMYDGGWGAEEEEQYMTPMEPKEQGLAGTTIYPAGLEPEPKPALDYSRLPEQEVTAPEFGDMAEPMAPPPQAGGYNPMGAMQDLQNAAMAEGKAKAAQNDALAGHYEAQAKAQQTFAEESAKRLAPIEKNINDLQSDIAKKKVDPDQFWNSRTTGQKVGFTIAALLSGLGAGLQGPNAKNMALESLDNSINKDIESQKIDMGKKQTLLGDYYRQYGNMQQAENQTKLHMLGVAQAKLAATAAKTNNPVLLAQAEKGSALIRAQMAPYFAQQAQYEAVSGLKQQIKAGAKVDPYMAIQAFVPKGLQKDAYKEIGDFKNAQANLNKIDHVLNRQYELQTVGSRVGSPFGSNSLLDKSTSDLFTVIKGIVGERLSDADVRQMVEPNSVKFTDSEAVKNEKIAGLKSGIMTTLAGKLPILSNPSYGVDLSMPEAQAKVQPVERMDKASGKIALFDPTTKQFLGYK